MDYSREMPHRENSYSRERDYYPREHSQSRERQIDSPN
jgi:hypothetical protein